MELAPGIVALGDKQWGLVRAFLVADGTDLTLIDTLGDDHGFLVQERLLARPLRDVVHHDLIGPDGALLDPVRSEELMHQVAQIESVRGLRDENRALRRVDAADSRMYRFHSPAMADVERLAGKVAPTDSTVLITGESGTGKGMIARWIHENSGRARGAFLPVNCSAIPEQLLESEFFGHTKGAFTGADRARRGLFVEADHGTLFLDEIGELPLHMQTKLLSVIEEKTVPAVGSDQPRRVDTRVIAATNRDLAEMVKQGRFREDLYFRLAMFHLHLPPLRERRADLPGFIRHTLAAMRRSGVPMTGLMTAPPHRRRRGRLGRCCGSRCSDRGCPRGPPRRRPRS